VIKAVWTELVRTTRDIIQGRGLTAGGVPLPAAQVYARKVFSDRNTTLPFLMAVRGPHERIEPGSFEDHEWLLPVLVGHCFASNQDLELNEDEDAWRQDVIETFANQPRPEITLPGVDVNSCDIDPQPVLDLTLFGDNLDVGGLLLWFRLTKSRNRP
jgi:hypothetical protein